MTQTILLYTANLRGAIDLLPRLHTFIKGLRAEAENTLLVDLGEACTPDIWHCDITEGRSMLIALDGLGYTAANAATLSAENREKLALQSMMALVDADHPHTHGDWLFALNPTEGDGHLCVVLIPAETTLLDGHTLFLARIDAGQIGQVKIALNESPRLVSADILTLPPNTPPDPTIAGVVDFVLDEARYLQKKQNKN